MKRKNLDITVPAVLYIKSKLLLNGFGDLSIKDMLRQMGLDVDKPFKISLENEYWLKYECGNRKVVFRFDETRRKQDNKKILTIYALEDCLVKTYGFFHNVSKTNIIEIDRKDIKSIYLSNGKVVDLLDSELDINAIDTKISIEEIMHSGVEGPFGVIINGGVYPIDEPNTYKLLCPDFYISFSITNWNEDSYYNLNLKPNDKLDSFLRCLTQRLNSKSESISIMDVYQEICNTYGLCVENMRQNYEVRLSITDYNKQNYSLEEKDGVIKVLENGVVSKYVRETEKGIVRLRRIKGNSKGNR